MVCFLLCASAAIARAGLKPPTYELHLCFLLEPLALWPDGFAYDREIYSFLQLPPTPHPKYWALNIGTESMGTSSLTLG